MRFQSTKFGDCPVPIFPKFVSDKQRRPKHKTGPSTVERETTVKSAHKLDTSQTTLTNFCHIKTHHTHTKNQITSQTQVSTKEQQEQRICKSQSHKTHTHTHKRRESEKINNIFTNRTSKAKQRQTSPTVNRRQTEANSS